MSQPPPYDASADQKSGYGAPPPYAPQDPSPIGFTTGPATSPGMAGPGVGTGPYGPSYVGSPGSSVVVMHQPGSPGMVQPVYTQPVVVVAGATCPSCRAGVLRNEMTCLGILCCICFFPLGVICLMLMMERRCSNCGLSFG